MKMKIIVIHKTPAVTAAAREKYIKEKKTFLILFS